MTLEELKAEAKRDAGKPMGEYSTEFDRLLDVPHARRFLPGHGQCRQRRDSGDTNQHGEIRSIEKC